MQSPEREPTPAQGPADVRKLVHISDLHFGKIIYPRIVDALIEEINGMAPDVVAISGDLTQRARTAEYQAAARMIEALDPPVLVVPGNHDVYAWWYLVPRLFRPLRRFRRYIGEDETPAFEMNGLAVLGLNSAHGRTIKGGYIRRPQRTAIRDFFESKNGFKVLVVHHHLTQIQALGPHDVARKARKTLETAGEMGVDLVLCGHLHISHIEPIEIMPANHRMIIASAGTATSSRGRREHRRTNFYNAITVGREQITIEERRFEPEKSGFVSESETSFPRN